MVRDRVKARGWSMREFASKLDPKRTVDSVHGYVSKIVNGKVSPPLNDIERWADFLRIDGADRKRFILLAKLAHGHEEIEESFLDLERRYRTLAEAARLRGLLP